MTPTIAHHAESAAQSRYSARWTGAVGAWEPEFGKPDDWDANPVIEDHVGENNGAAGAGSLAWDLTGTVRGPFLKTDGSANYFQAALPAEITYANPFTIAFWARRGDSATTQMGLLNIGSATSKILTSYWSTTYNGLFFSHGDNAAYCVKPTSALAMNVWRRYLITCAGGNTALTMYINGGSNSQAAGAFWTAWGATESLTIGVGYNGGYRSAVDFDSVRLLSRVLTPAEISADYARSSGMFELAVPLEPWFRPMMMRSAA